MHIVCLCHFWFFGTFVWIPHKFSLRIVQSNLQEGLTRCLFLILQEGLLSRSFLILLKAPFLKFSIISVHLMMLSSSIPKYLQFSFSRTVPMLFWLAGFFPSFVSLFFFLHYQHGTFFKIHSHILVVCSYHLYQGFKAFWSLANINAIDIHKVVYLVIFF